MKLISATCRFPADEVRTSAQGRQYISALFADDAGQQHRVFGPPTFEPLRQLQPGQRVMLAEDSKGKLHLVEPDPVPSAQYQQSQPMGFAPPATVVQQQGPGTYQVAPAPTPAVPADPVIDAAETLARLYHHLTQRGVPDALAGPMSSTAFIQLARR